MSNTARRQGQPAYTSGVGYLLSALGREAERSWSAAIAAVGVTQVEFAVLTVLCEQGGLSQRTLALRAGQDPRNVVATVARLTARGFVAADTDPQDRRRKVLGPTAAARAVMRRLGTALRAERETFLVPLDDDEQEQLRSLLVRVHRHRRPG